MSGEPAIETHELRKRYGGKEALRGLTLKVPAGSICGFLGRNGAGKTTTLKTLIGLTKPGSGSGRVFGMQIDREQDSIRIRQRTGFVTEDKLFPQSLTVGELLDFTRPFYPNWSTDLEQRYLRSFELPLRATAGRLSKGARCGLALVLAIARGADLLLLDEPTEGLDPVMKEKALQAIVALTADQGATIFFSSHQVEEVEQIADHICMIEEGRVLVNDSLDELRASYRRVHLVFDGEAPEDGFAGARKDGRTLSLLVAGNPDQVVERARSLRARSIDFAPVTLKEIFLDRAKGVSI